MFKLQNLKMFSRGVGVGVEGEEEEKLTKA